MRWLWLALLPAAVLAQGHGSLNRNAQGGGAAPPLDRAVLRLLPTTGAGAGAVTDAWCGWLNTNSKLAGNYICMDGDGTQVSSTALAAVGTAPTTSTQAVCPNGADCATASAQRFGGSGHYATANVTTPAGADFTTCAVVRADDFATTPYLVSHWDSAVETFTLTANPATLYINNGTGNYNVGNSTLLVGAWHAVCATYDAVADGTSVGRFYLDGTLVTTNSTMGLVQSKNTKLTVGANSSAGRRLTGNLRGAFYTETLLSAGDITTLTTRALAALTTKQGGTVTTTRATGRACTNGAGSALAGVGVDRPCWASTGLSVWGARTNSALRSDALDNAAWNKPAGISAVTANTATLPDGTITMDRVTKTVTSDASLYQGVTVASGTRFVASAWVAATSGTAVASLGIDCPASGTTCTCKRSDGGACTTVQNLTYCYAYTTATTTPVRLETRVACPSAATALNIIMAPGNLNGGTNGTADYGGLQIEPGLSAGPYVRTDGTAVQRNEDVVTTGAITLTPTPSFSADVIANLRPTGELNFVLEPNAGAGTRWNVYLNPTGTLRCEYYNGTAYGVTTTGTVTTGTTAHLRCNWDGTTMSACIGGTCATAAKSFTAATAFTQVRYGTDVVGGATALDGTISNVCIGPAGVCL